MFNKIYILAALAFTAGFTSAAPSPGAHVGDATVYFPGLGACGVTNTDADLVAGVSQAIFDSFGNQTNPADNPVCGRFIVVNAPNGKSVRARVEEKCGGCAPDSILLSHAAFGQLEDPSVGVIHGVSWLFFIK